MNWEKAAGGKQVFEVATIKLADLHRPIQPNLGLSAENGPPPPGGLFLARGTAFAYKIMPTHEQERAMVTSLPKWVATQSFHTYLVGGRDFTMPQIAEEMPIWQDFGRPVVDQTGLRGTYDFSLNSTPDVLNSTDQGNDAQLGMECRRSWKH